MSEQNDETVIASRKQPVAPVADETVIAARKQPSAPAAPAADETVIASRKQSPASAPVADETVIASRKQAPAPIQPAVAEETLLAARKQAPTPMAEETQLASRVEEEPGFISTREVVAPGALDEPVFERREIPEAPVYQSKYTAAVKASKPVLSAQEQWDRNTKRNKRRSTTVVIALVASAAVIGALVAVVFAVLVK